MVASETALTPAERAIRVNIATTAAFLGQPVQRYKARKYELTIQRRLACCDGPMVESNKISFEVVP